MKRILLAGIAALALAGPAHAQFGFGGGGGTGSIVFDPTSNLERIAEAGRAIQQARLQLAQLEASYAAITRVTDLGTAVSALSSMGIRAPLPVSPYQVQGLLNGQGGTGGMIGSLGNLMASARTANTVFVPTHNSWIAGAIERAGGSIAGAQAVALQLYQSSAERAPLLDELQARLNTAVDPSEREALIARIGIEQAHIANAQAQTANIGVYMQAQYQSREQQREERMQQAIDEVLGEASGRGVW